jgi:hypothetical protein
MIDINIKLSDWKALDAIQTLIKLYKAGEETDYDTIIAIRDVLNNFGFLDD